LVGVRVKVAAPVKVAVGVLVAPPGVKVLVTVKVTGAVLV
jgi:hypothetical protein